MKTFVSYDIVEDKVRRKIFEACKDYGLAHVQYSLFFGDLTRNRREELFQCIRRILGRKEGKVLMCPICDKDLRLLKEIEISATLPAKVAEERAPYHHPGRKKVQVI